MYSGGFPPSSGFPPSGYPTTNGSSYGTSDTGSSGGFTPSTDGTGGFPSQYKRSQEEHGSFTGYSDSTGMAGYKKPRVEEPSAPPSKVLHVRNIPSEATEADIIGVCCPFGHIENVLILKGKAQAFVQMADITAASALLTYYASIQAVINSRPVYFQYSRRQEITKSPKEETPNYILLVEVQNLAYPVTIEVLHQIFSKYGELIKIIMFQKRGFQALIQFTDVNSAIAAKDALDNQNIYSGCCTLRIQYSSFENLNVKYNNERSRDFKNPGLPYGPSHGGTSTSGSSSSRGMAGWGAPTPNSKGPTGWGGPRFGMSSGSFGQEGYGMPDSGRKVLICSNLNEVHQTPERLFTLFGVYGDVVRVKILYNKQDTALIQFSTSKQAEIALSYLNGLTVFGNEMKINFSKHDHVSVPREDSGQDGKFLTKDFSGSPFHRYKHAGSKNYQHICPPSKILHLSNINPSVTQEELFSLFSQYGTVIAFKFFQNNRKMGLIEFDTLDSALKALMGLHCHSIGDVALRISFSKSKIPIDHPDTVRFFEGSMVPPPPSAEGGMSTIEKGERGKESAVVEELWNTANDKGEEDDTTKSIDQGEDAESSPQQKEDEELKEEEEESSE